MSGQPLFVGPLITLRTVPAFSHLSQRQLAALAQDAEEVVLERGTRLLEPGQSATAIHVVVEGVAVLETRGGPVEVGPGGTVGYVEALARTPVSAPARARTEMVALRLEAESLRDACEAHFGILAALVNDVGVRVARDREAVAAAVAADGSPVPPGGGVRLDRVGRILALHRAPAFPSEGMDALAELAGQLAVRRFDAGERLWTGRGEDVSAFLVCEGEAELGHTGWSEPLRVGPGSVPGLVAALAELPDVVTARALTPLVALHIGREELLDVLEDHAEMAFAFLARLAGAVLEAES